VPTWQEHLRQHVEPGAVADSALDLRAVALVCGQRPSIRHLVWAYDVPPAVPDATPAVVAAAVPGPTPSAAPAAADPP
jgi:hypothetical protein